MRLRILSAFNAHLGNILQKLQLSIVSYAHQASIKIQPVPHRDAPAAGLDHLLHLPLVPLNAQVVLLEDIKTFLNSQLALPAIPSASVFLDLPGVSLVIIELDRSRMPQGVSQPVRVAEQHPT
jgi:hypothetical protein